MPKTTPQAKNIAPRHNISPCLEIETVRGRYAKTRNLSEGGKNQTWNLSEGGMPKLGTCPRPARIWNLSEGGKNQTRNLSEGGKNKIKSKNQANLRARKIDYQANAREEEQR